METFVSDIDSWLATWQSLAPLVLLLLDQSIKEWYGFAATYLPACNLAATKPAVTIPSLPCQSPSDNLQ
jgi:hypothetical protein